MHNSLDNLIEIQKEIQLKIDKPKDTIICECGFEGSKGHIARHRKSPSHIKFMEENKLLLN